ncbi:sodium:solute symporter family protein [Virgibacillus alimentarius]|uniref:SSS family solute:Na+ symporter n=1 Tax=Virgibacillus alimentarius TaxID=698769 RepID=A0ABS4SB63_9BACI|nr:MULTISPECIES: sodium:solute symporter family protein [Virgibacillus]MBP2258746.1 SSS family solute:Na+ symporter [Virgibacillus alimentarius]HLR66896.1 sodium:solute symporter family protein [Virgibacillus sp.]
MTTVGYWFMGLALAYTCFLLFAGQIAKRRAKKASGFFIGGRNFGTLFVMVCITGLFSGSSFIAIIELSYLTGISAVWYGVAETIHILIIAFVLIGPFRKKALITISGLIGDHYGEKIRAFSGAITAFTFPMWSVATALAFASAMSVFTGMPLVGSVAITAVLLLIYLQFGGMWSIGFTQLSNVIVFFIMLIIGTIAFFINPGIDGIQELFTQKPELASWTNIGMQTIIAWFGTFLVNVLLAQAAFQMALSCKTEKEGQKGLIYAALIGIPLIIGAVVFGLAAAAVLPGKSLGLIAVPLYLMDTLPAPLVGLFFLGFWAAALSWGAPCQFSGATSLGKDVGSAINPKATEKQLINYTRWSLVILTLLMIVFAFLRSEQSAWWNVFAWVTRNSATFAPVAAALFWPIVTKRAALISLFSGSISGLLWYHFGGWHVTEFYLNTHPVWVGMSINLFTISLVTIIDNKGTLNYNVLKNKRSYLSLCISAILAGYTVFSFEKLYQTGLLGMVIFINIIFIFIHFIHAVHTVGRDYKHVIQNAN